MAKGEAAQAAPLFARLAEVLINANRPRRAANLHAQAAQAYAASHNEAATLTQARAALTLFLQLQMDQRAPNFYAYLTRKLTDEGMNGAVETLTREFGARVGSVPAPEAHQAAAQAAQHARLPTNCPKCGAPLRSNEVRWVEANTAECDYCGTPIQPGA